MTNERQVAEASSEPAIPATGLASSYSDYFVNRLTASGQVYLHTNYTAAILPRARWRLVRMGTRVRITHGERTIVVVINDKGAGSGGMERVLDLSRTAMSALVGWTLVTDRDAMRAGIIQLDAIEVVPAETPLGPVATGEDAAQPAARPARTAG